MWELYKNSNGGGGDRINFFNINNTLRNVKLAMKLEPSLQNDAGSSKMHK